ncbi:MAG: hypothetical protein WC993_01255 [Methanoculleus sp.]
MVKFVMISICTVPPAEGISYLHPVLKGGQVHRSRSQFPGSGEIAAANGVVALPVTG